MILYISVSMCVCITCVWVYMLSRFSWVQLFATLWTVARQAPLSMGFSGKNSGPPVVDRGLPFWLVKIHVVNTLKTTSGANLLGSLFKEMGVLFSPPPSCQECGHNGWAMSIHSTLDHKAEGRTLEMMNQRVGRILGLDNSLDGLSLEFLCERIKSYWLVTISFYFLVQSLSHVRLFVIPWTAACQDSLSFTISHSLLKFMPIKLMMLYNQLILCQPRLLLPLIFPRIRVFSNKLALCIRWLKYWSFSFNISPSTEYSGLISFRIDCFDLLAVQGTLKNLLCTTIRKHQFSAQPSLWYNSHICTWLVERP